MRMGAGFAAIDVVTPLYFAERSVNKFPKIKGHSPHSLEMRAVSIVVQAGITNEVFIVNQTFNVMKVINTKTHGYLDYIMGVLLIASPWIFDFARNGAETWVPVCLGVATIIYSLLTKYELGAYPAITMRTHLMLDTINGIFLAISPWLFGFADYIWQPHLILGVLELGAVLMTKSEPGATRTPAERNMNRTFTAH
jgi:hypothetical protein